MSLGNLHNHKNNMYKTIAQIVLMLSLGLAGIAEAAPEALIKMPYSYPLGDGTNIYFVIDAPKELGLCAGIKYWQINRGETHDEYSEYLYPQIAKISGKIKDLQKVCGTDNACFASRIATSDVVIIQTYATMLKSDQTQTTTYDMGIAALAYCGRAEQH